ncbi:class A beta-lactamase-related serine hydrolase [Flavobacteriaceae bacterium]|nr:class A beta-lactamase-related serine hydrolase [Flavobacteriaceae bacterium]
MRQLLLSILFLFLFQGCFLSENPIKKSMKNDNFLTEILKNKEEYEIQIAYTEISRNKDGEPIFKDFEFQVDENKYFYPASTIKLPIVVLTLDKINELRSSGIDITLKSKILISSNHSKKNEIQLDTITSFQNLIADVFLVSDNYSSNILIDFIGYNYFNTKMSQAGLKNTYLNHKFNPDPYVNIDWLIQTVDKQLISSNQDQIIVTANQNISGLKKGENKFQDGSIVSGSLDFSQKNRHSIRDMHNLLKRIIFPSKLDKENVFNLNVEDYDFLRYWMSRYTYEDLGDKFRNDKKYFDSYNKFFIHGKDTVVNNRNIRVYNKLGQAYGTSIDNAYIRNYQDDIEFFLTATIYTNKNKTINDNIYEYDQTAIPFLSKFSQSIYSRLSK